MKQKSEKKTENKTQNKVQEKPHKASDNKIKTQFKKGKSGNPNGRPPQPEEVKTFKKLTTLEYKRLVDKYLFFTQEEIYRRLKEKNLVVLEYWLLSSINDAIKKGDYSILDRLLSRSIGSPTQKLNMDLDIEAKAKMTMANDLSKIDMDTLLKMAQKAGVKIDANENGY